MIGKITALRRAARHPVHPDNSYLSVAGPARPAAGPDQVDDPDRRADRAAGAGRRGRDDARRRGGPQRDRRHDRRSSGAATIDSLRLKSTRASSLTLYSCGARYNSAIKEDSDVGHFMIDIGHTIGNYKITAKLGEGGMGVVYLAEHPVIGKKVAMKAIHPELSQELRRRLALRDRGEGGQPDRPRAHRRHRRLRQHARRRVLLRDGVPAGRVAVRPPAPRDTGSTPTAALSIAAQIADALNASHEQGIIHRDLKPENIFLVPPRREPRLRQGARLRPREADADRSEGHATRRAPAR